MSAPIGPPTVPTGWVSRLATLVSTIRHDWDEAGVRAALAKVVDRPLGVVSAAAINAALTRTDQRSPAIIAMSGTHWPADTQWRDVSSNIVTWCDHSKPGTSCAECYPPKPAGVAMPPEVRERIRQDAAEGRAHVARLRIDTPRTPTSQED